MGDTKIEWTEKTWNPLVGCAHVSPGCDNCYAWRARHLSDTPAAVRFVSCEPLLGSLPSLDLTGIDWVIAGGESGPRARPMHPDWARDLRDRCAETGTTFHFKQAGAGLARQWGTADRNGSDWEDPAFPDEFKTREYPRG